VDHSFRVCYDYTVPAAVHRLAKFRQGYYHYFHRCGIKSLSSDTTDAIDIAFLDSSDPAHIAREQHAAVLLETNNLRHHKHDGLRIRQSSQTHLEPSDLRVQNEELRDQNALLLEELAKVRAKNVENEEQRDQNAQLLEELAKLRAEKKLWAEKAPVEGANVAAAEKRLTRLEAASPRNANPKSAPANPNSVPANPKSAPAANPKSAPAAPKSANPKSAPAANPKSANPKSAPAANPKSAPAARTGLEDLLQVFDSVDEDETGFAPRRDLKAAVDELICKDSTVQILSEVLGALHQMIMEREEFEDHITDWLSARNMASSLGFDLSEGDGFAGFE